MHAQDANNSWQLGYYSGEYSTCNNDLPQILGRPLPCRQLYSLAPEETDGIHCIVIDLRYSAKSVLSLCCDISAKIPVIGLVRSDQIFDDDYPYGTHVSDLTTIEDYGGAVFRQRVKQAIEHYRVPISIKDVKSPVYAVIQEITNQASEWILLKDLDHRFIVVGEQFAEVSGVSISDIIGRDDLEIGGGKNEIVGNPIRGKRGFWCRDDEVTSNGISTVEYNTNWKLYSPDARHRKTHRVALKNPADEVYGLLVCSRDVTEQVANSQLLSERTMMLKQVMEEKGRADHNRQIAEEAVEAKTLFMAAASHDLRQPLHAIGLFLDSLDKRLAGTAEQHLVQQIKQSCSSLGSLVAGCLDVSKLDAGAVTRDMKHWVAADLLSTFTEEFSYLAAEKSLEYNLIVDDSILYSDRDLLSRIVRNLFTNALQNTQHGCITIKCQQRGSNIQLSVLDSGRGIAIDELDRVFQEFHQIDTRESRQGRGLGLGLSIVKRLSYLLDIDVELESEQGKGSCFVLSIPKGLAENVHSLPEEETVSTPNELCVLIIEDDLRVLNGMEVFLESYGWQILSAQNLQSALALLDSGIPLPNIIVADYHLAGDSTGIEAIQACRKKMGAQVPALLVTGDTSLHSTREATRFQLPVLHKPVNTDELLASIKKEVCRSRAENRSRRLLENPVY